MPRHVDQEADGHAEDQADQAVAAAGEDGSGYPRAGHDAVEHAERRAADGRERKVAIVAFFDAVEALFPAIENVGAGGLPRSAMRTLRGTEGDPSPAIVAGDQFALSAGRTAHAIESSA